MKAKGTMAMAAVLAVLAGTAWWEAHQAPAPQTFGSEVALWSLSTGELQGLQALTIDAATDSVTFQHAKDAWHLASQPKRALDLARWTSALDELQHPIADRKVADTVSDPGEFGLARPQLTVKLVGPKRQVLQVGDKTPSGNDYFAMIRGKKPLYTVPTYLVDTWTKLATDPPLATVPSPAPSPPPSPPPPHRP